MKKTIMLVGILMIVVMAMTAYARPVISDPVSGEIEFQGKESNQTFVHVDFVDDSKEKDDSYEDSEREDDQQHIEDSIRMKGLENAIVHVGNKSAALVLQRNLERLEQHSAAKIALLEEVHIRAEGNETYVKGKAPGRLLGLLAIQKTIEYRIDDDGKVVRVPKWYDALVRDE